MTRTDQVAQNSTGAIIDPDTGQPTGQITILSGELITYDVSDSTDYGSYRVIRTGARVTYPAGGSQIVESMQPVTVTSPS